MKIDSINSTDFRGIKLSKPDFNDTRDLAMYLKRKGVDVLGYKKAYTRNKTISMMADKIRDIRSQNRFVYNQCGVVIFPWMKKAWIIGDKEYEKELIKIVNDFDAKAKLIYFI